MEQDGATAEAVIKILQELLRKLKYYEVHLSQRKASIHSKLPETKQSLDLLAVLISKRDQEKVMEVDYCLSDNVYSSCEISSENDKVGLWLGANVMVEYGYEEAVAMLTKNYENGEKRLKSLDAELGFVKEQITTTEVTMARVYNHDIKQRREQKEKEEAGKGTTGTK